MLAAGEAIKRSLGVSTNDDGSWRTHEYYFHEPIDPDSEIPEGTVNFSPAWFMQGHRWAVRQFTTD